MKTSAPPARRLSHLRYQPTPGSVNLSSVNPFRPRFRALRSSGPLLHTILENQTYTKEDFVQEDNIVGFPKTDAKQEANSIPFPVQCLPMYVISIKKSRFLAMKKRLGPWSVHAKRWPSQDGRLIVKEEWIRLGRIARNCPLRRGEIGCYQSHVTAWENLVASPHSSALIMEDDANIVYSQSVADAIQAGLKQAADAGIKWDLFYLGHVYRTPNVAFLSEKTPNLRVPTGCQCLFAYMITKEGAKKLLSKCRPFREPIDLYTLRMGRDKHIVHITLEPSLCQQFDERDSQTRWIF